MSAAEAIARLFEDYADILEAQGDEYRPRSYRNAAESIREYPGSIEDLAADGEAAVQEIEGVGESLAGKIVEYVETGEIETIEEAREEFPVEMDAITAVEGVGPKTAGDLYRELGVTTLDELEQAARNGEIREIEGFGEKTEQNILEGIEFARRSRERRRLGDARPIGEDVRDYLRTSEAVERAELAGSLRRWRETIGDVDVLVAGEDREAIVEHFLGWGGEEIESGESKASLRVSTRPDDRLSDDEATTIRVDLRIVDSTEWGAALQYFTGSKDHNVRVRNRAIDRDMKVNEYGVFDVSGIDDPDEDTRAGERIAGESEAAVYDALGLDWMPPELREDRGEVEAAASGDLPDLIEPDEIRGDLHVHTDWSDGGNSIEEMVEAAAAFGHEYVCVTDHASGPGVVGGMGLVTDDVLDQVEEVRGVAETADIEVFAGIEANIDADGGISLGEAALEALDLVIASPHSGLDGDGTDRIVGAIEDPAVDVIGHPSGRLINGRPGLDLDVDRVAEVAADEGVALEVNANPARLDLWGEAVEAAVEAGAPVAIDTDAHSPDEYEYVEYGVHTARRGWAERGDVLNACTADELRAFLDS